MPAAVLAPTASIRIAWAGAGLFVLSLLWTAHAYLIGFDHRAPRLSIAAAVAFDAGLFSAFALHHSLLARSGARQIVSRWAPPELERAIYVWTASLLLIAVGVWWQAVPGTLYTLHGRSRAVAWAVQLAGLLVTIRSSAPLDVLALAGVRQVQAARSGTSSRPATLRTDGLYGFVRHPLYFGWVLMVGASPDMSATRATFALVTTAYLAIAIPWEERALVRLFGADYEAYRRRVRWRMVPGVY
jgi:protein-S-isoprenylcysteine O-methyltransferase Ste14